MRSMRICQVARTIYLVRFYFSEYVDGDLYIFLAHGILFNGACFIEGKIQEMRILFFDSYISAGGPGLASPDQSLNGPDLRGVNLV